MIRKGEAWGSPAAGPPEVVVAGPDRALAHAVPSLQGQRVWFRPAGASDFARALGLVAGEQPGATLVPVDALRIDAEGTPGLGINMVVVGCAPDRQRWWSRSVPVAVTVDGRAVHDGPATAVVVANGEYLRGADLVPRGHPGDGRVEVQVYALRRTERRGMRARLGAGEHLPHPRITSTSGRQVRITASRAVAWELDGGPRAPVRTLSVDVEPHACTLYV